MAAAESAFNSVFGDQVCLTLSVYTGRKYAVVHWCMSNVGPRRLRYSAASVGNRRAARHYQNCPMGPQHSWSRMRHISSPTIGGRSLNLELSMGNMLYNRRRCERSAQKTSWRHFSSVHVHVAPWKNRVHYLKLFTVACFLFFRISKVLIQINSKLSTNQG
jgi:hypothetical protein